MEILDIQWQLDLRLFLGCFVAFFALVNPIQKIFVVTTLQESMNRKDLHMLVLKASWAALIILFVFLFLGNIIFSYIFQIKLYSFRITCGIVLLYNGFIALQKGVMINIDKNTKLSDVSIVPVAMPMIAGPGTITAAVTFPAQYGTLIAVSAIFMAIFINYLIMYFANYLGKIMIKYNFMTSLLRITGLIVATIGIQMISDGIAEFIKLNHIS